MTRLTTTDAGDTPAITTGRRALIFAYSVVIFLYWVALYLYVPTLPNYVQSKAPDLALVGGVLAMYGLWQGIVRFPVGLAADWVGRRKPFILAGLVLAGLGALIMERAAGVEALFVGRAITGLAAGAWVPMIAAFSALFPPAEAVRASALVSMLSSLGCIAGTGAGGPLNELGGYPLPFTLAAGVAGLSFALALGLREQRRPGAHPSLGHIGRFALRPDILVPSLLSAGGHYVLFAATYSFIPIQARTFGMGNVAQGALVSFNLALITAGNLAVASLNRRFRPRQLNYASFAMLFLGLSIAAVARTSLALFAAQAWLGLGQGIGYPVQMGQSIRYVGDGERTMALGIFASIYAAGMFTGPALSGVIASAIGIQPMFAITAIACLAGGFWGTRRLRE